MKTVVWGKFIDINAYIKKKISSQQLNFTPKELEKNRIFSQPNFRLRKEGLEKK